LVKELGNIGELEIEAKALLAEHNVNDQEFPAPALACLPEIPWHIPAKEFTTRRDLRFHRIFTIDPQTAKGIGIVVVYIRKVCAFC
jgi:protein SSD1